ncbi:hypothetical protein [[Clostridium] hylemonae]|uniref:hypothetical protein n=1 Tax=[Clostridium] hylemonae TaxID=89153 RepID=UPI001106C012|nr:hypothetical protein [[Clostridium] hylemonae]
MARPSRWDKYETALLVEAYIKVTEGGEIKTKVLQELSNNLRKMAVNKGLEIDEVFRNLNGMMWQYFFIEKTFKKSGVGQHLPAKVFRDVVELYVHNRKKFDEILKEAKKLVNRNEEVSKLYEEQALPEKKVSLTDVDDRIVDFSEQGIYKETRPCKVSYAGEELKEVESWTDVYVFVVRYLCKEYPHVMDEIADSFAYGESTAIVAHIDGADKFNSPVEVGERLIMETNQSADNIIWNIRTLLNKCNVSHESLKIYYRKHNCTNTTEQNNMRTICEYENQKQIRKILQKHYAYGYRINSSIELNRFKNFAKVDGIVLPNSDDKIKAEIRNIGYLIGDKVYVITDEILAYLNAEFRKLFEEGHNIFFYESVYKVYQNFMEENYISSEDMLKEILKQNRKTIFAEFADIYFAKNFISLQGKVVENEAVAGEIIRCWGNVTVREANSFTEELPYIPEDIIKRYLSMNRKFAWVSEGAYVLIDRLIISQTEERDIRDYVWTACKINGFVSISDIPLGNLIEENYELTSVGLLTAIYNKVLFKDFHLNGKILTRDKSDLDAVALVKVYLENKRTCTFDEANQKVTQLTGGNYRYMAYRALYETLVRIDKDNYVHDSMVDFDIDTIDQILTNIITDRGFIAIKEVTTFALFPICNYAWNHYLLESYCYRFSEKYSLRYKMLNDKNSGIIAEKKILDDYDNLLAKAVARANVTLRPEIVGKYLADTGYTAKKKFVGLENVIKKAASIREEI